MRSLRLQLLAGLLIPLTAIVLINLSIAYRNAAVIASIVTDRTLLASARSIAEQVRSDGHGIVAVIPPAALGMLASGHADLAYYRVTGPDASLIAGYPDLPDPPSRIHDLQPHYYDATFRSDPIRLVAVMQPVPSASITREAFVIVGQTLRAREAMVTDLGLQSAQQQAVLVAIAALLAWFGLRRDLAPLLRLSHEVAQRKPNEFKPFSAAAVQSELRPFVAALNRYMERHEQQLDAQRRFAANASHQLRTPLTIIRTQAEYALRGYREDDKNDALRAIVLTVKQVTRLTNQLLSLSKVDAGGYFARANRVNMEALTRQVLEEHAERAVERDIDLAFEVQAPGAAIALGDPTMLRELIINLVDNALRYTPVGGCVTVTIAHDAGRCLLRVQDTGPGIPPAERELVFERFYRILGGDAEGSGLGLAIVKEIVQADGGTISLGEPPDGRGLVVDVRLPADASRYSASAASTNSAV